MRTGLNLGALGLLALQYLLTYRNAHYIPFAYTPSFDAASIAQWLGTFVGFNLFGLIGFALLLFANTGKRIGPSHVVQNGEFISETSDSETELDDDENTVWEELKEWPKGPEADGTKE